MGLLSVGLVSQKFYVIYVDAIFGVKSAKKKNNKNLRENSYINSIRIWNKSDK